MDTLSNIDLETALKNVKYFRGVYSMDNLPKKINKNEYTIVNLDKSTGPGTHWVLIANRSNDDHIYYFDSFGIGPSEEITRYLKTSKKPIMYSNAQLQKTLSSRCGFFCLYLIQQLENKKSFYDSIFSLKQHPSTFNESKVKS